MENSAAIYTELGYFNLGGMEAAGLRFGIE